jgi:DNA-binding PadR family transcriptional regulator
MSPVFRHGRLRLYLLRLLDEEPRHGYEVIRQLRDQFMGVYAPSPGTIYPRLARLEEEGLVTHDEVDGRKVYRITEAGREELRNRSDELDELEEELHASVTDIVREVKEDVRDTVRNLREELTWAAREVRRQEKDDLRDPVSRARDEAREHIKQARDQAKHVRDQAKQARDQSRDQAQQARDQARQTRDQAREIRDEARVRSGQAWEDTKRAWQDATANFYSPGEQDQAGHGLGGWPGWTEWSRWTDAPGRWNWPGPHDVTAFRDLERLAREFAGDLRKVAWDSGAIGTDVLGNLRDILEETLERIKTELFSDSRADPQDEPPAKPTPATPSPPATPSAPSPPGAPSAEDPEPRA